MTRGMILYCLFPLGWEMLKVEDIPNTAEGAYLDILPWHLYLEHKLPLLTGFYFKCVGLSWKDFEETRNWSICRGAETASS